MLFSTDFDLMESSTALKLFSNRDEVGGCIFNSILTDVMGYYACDIIPIVADPDNTHFISATCDASGKSVCRTIP